MWPRPRASMPGRTAPIALGNSEEIDLEGPPKRVEVEVGNQGERPEPGAREDDVDRPLGGLDRPDGPAQGLPLGDVRDLGGEPRTGRAELLGHLLEVLRVDVDHAHRHVLAGQLQGRGAADAVGRAGDQDVGLFAHGQTSRVFSEWIDSRNSRTASTKPSGFSSGARCFAPGIRRPRQSGKLPDQEVGRGEKRRSLAVEGQAGLGNAGDQLGGQPGDRAWNRGRRSSRRAA